MNKEEIEAEKDRLIATFDKELNQKKKKLNDQIGKLEKQREKFLIDNKGGYYCKCGKFVEKSKGSLSHETRKLCWECFRIMQEEKRKKEFLNKIKGAKIIDIKLTCYDSVESLTVYKDGMMFRFKAETDDEVSYIELDDEWPESLDNVIDRPGAKPRLEKPLPILLNNDRTVS
ncbi:MAG: hypothetical protein KAV40_06000 [Thermoplasmatales archaeon]|nr:hypothetical protein [Thermoplasmatales archaeon]